jgi:hypothetical protein
MWKVACDMANAKAGTVIRAGFPLIEPRPQLAAAARPPNTSAARKVLAVKDSDTYTTCAVERPISLMTDITAERCII